MLTFGELVRIPHEQGRNVQQLLAGLCWGKFGLWQGGVPMPGRAPWGILDLKMKNFSHGRRVTLWHSLTCTARDSMGVRRLCCGGGDSRVSSTCVG